MKRIGITFLTATLMSAAACTHATDEPVQQAEAQLLDGAYAPANWSSNGITGGTTSVTGDASQMTLSYNVTLGGGGVSYRTTTFSAVAADTGTVSFDWQYDFFHAWYSVHADLILFADSSTGTTQIPLVDFFNQSYTGSQSFSGSTSIPVESGYAFGFIVGGSNFDSYSHLSGDVIISNFVTPDPCADPSNATIIGTEGDDELLGTSGDDVIFGLGGDDVIVGKGGNDILCGGAGSDSISGGDGDDYIGGGAGYNFLNGDNGNDTIVGGDDGNELQGNDGNDDLSGGAGVDTIYGGNGDDVLHGGGGDDDMYGMAGSDQLLGEEGEDYMSGGEGNDCLNGGAQDDRLLGEGGDDCLAGGDGVDQTACGDGNDSYSDGEWGFSSCESMGACANPACL